MKKLGLIGGMGPESTIEYYKGIVYGFQERLGVTDQFPELTIESVNIFKMLAYCNAKEYDSLIQYLLAALCRVHDAGAEFAALAANTPHIVFDALQEKSQIPLISIVSATRDKASKLGLKKVGLIGTQFTMNESFFYSPFQANGISVVAPPETDRPKLHHIIVNELEHGIFTSQAKNAVVEIINRMAVAQGTEGIILGCTELPLLVQESDIKIVSLNTMQIHIDALVEAILT